MPRHDPVPTAPNPLSFANNPKLPALVKKLPHPVLAKLIGAVGVEDAGPLVAMTTPQQMRALFDDVLWENPSPDLPARFSVGEFLRWLEVLNEESVAFTAERLQTLGEQFLSAALGRILDVHAKDAQFAGQAVSDDCEDFGDFLVRTLPGYDNHWDTVRTTLVALHDANPTFLDRVLRCCTPSWTGFVSERPYVLARVDESGDRETRREEAGFVSAETARAFLAEARVTAVETQTDGYDPISARYLARQPRGVTTSADAPTDAPIGDDELMDLLVVLGQIEGVARGPQLIGPGEPRSRTIRTRLADLERDRPDAFAARMGELVYLANILMAGISSVQMTEAEAPNVALAICNLGIELGMPAGDGLRNAAGLIRLFRMGWHTLCRVPPVAARRLVAVLRNPVIRERLRARAWILSEVDLAIADLVNRVDLAAFEDVEESLGIVSLVVEAETVQWLKALIAELPRLPTPTDDTERVVVRTRDIQNAEDLALVERFLAQLPEQIKW